jgi:hypothetical protein
MKSIYFSVPVSENFNTFLSAIKKYKDFSHYFWDRDSLYYPSYLQKADLFVLVLPEYAWDRSVNTLPVGCKKELEFAVKYGKPIFILYKSRDGRGEYNIYNAEIYQLPSGTKMIRGIPGTSNDIISKYNDTFNNAQLDKITNLSQIPPEFLNNIPNVTRFTVEQIIEKYENYLTSEEKQILYGQSFNLKDYAGEILPKTNNKTFNRKILLLNGY